MQYTIEHYMQQLVEQQKITNQMLLLPAVKAMGMNVNLTDPEGAEELVKGWLKDIGWPED